ncbi:MAG: metal-dependent hydrolase [Chthonomonadaceae bacterium]|nr:metal-dependent hydrolase [Chthonomonadaceae bacterium]
MILLLERKAAYKIKTDVRPVSERWHDADDMRWAARHWAARINVTLRSIQLRPMTTRWASISTRGRLTLNTELLDLPRDLGEFVIVHELVHLLCPNSGHGRVFKAFMMAYMPDWEVRERRLRQFTGSLKQ